MKKTPFGISVGCQIRGARRQIGPTENVVRIHDRSAVKSVNRSAPAPIGQAIREEILQSSGLQADETLIDHLDPESPPSAKPRGGI